MTVIETKIDRLVSMRERGHLTDAELINGFLLAVARADQAAQIRSHLAVLPDRLSNLVKQKLCDLAGRGFVWRPMLIGGKMSEDELEDLKKQLHEMHNSLGLGADREDKYEPM